MNVSLVATDIHNMGRSAPVVEQLLQGGGLQVRYITYRTTSGLPVLCTGYRVRMERFCTSSWVGPH